MTEAEVRDFIAKVWNRDIVNLLPRPNGGGWDIYLKPCSYDFAYHRVNGQGRITCHENCIRRALKALKP